MPFSAIFFANRVAISRGLRDSSLDGASQEVWYIWDSIESALYF
jgi:hypothetical protein